MIVLGLTGSIGMGKSTTADMFRAQGVPVFDSDASVHALYAPGGAAVEPVGKAFAGIVQAGGVDRAALSKAVLEQPGALAMLESILHPMVREAQAAFLAVWARAGAPIVVLDIPLLFETRKPNQGAQDMLDAVLVVTAPEHIQRERVLARPGMNEAKFAAILARQTPDLEKRLMADFTIHTGFGLEDAGLQVRQLLDALAEPAQEG